MTEATGREQRGHPPFGCLGRKPESHWAIDFSSEAGEDREAAEIAVSERFSGDDWAAISSEAGALCAGLGGRVGFVIPLVVWLVV